MWTGAPYISFVVVVVVIASHFNRSAPSHSYGTRTRNHTIFSIIPHEYLSEYAQKSIQCKTVSMWENTPNYIRDSESLGIFNDALKSFNEF